VKSGNETVMLRCLNSRRPRDSLAVNDALTDARYLSMHENDPRPPRGSLLPPRVEACSSGNAQQQRVCSARHGEPWIPVELSGELLSVTGTGAHPILEQRSACWSLPARIGSVPLDVAVQVTVALDRCAGAASANPTAARKTRARCRDRSSGPRPRRRCSRGNTCGRRAPSPGRSSSG
jgi:hypothetical protein